MKNKSQDLINNLRDLKLLINKNNIDLIRGLPKGRKYTSNKSELIERKEIKPDLIIYDDAVKGLKQDLSQTFAKRKETFQEFGSIMRMEAHMNSLPVAKIHPNGDKAVYGVMRMKMKQIIK